MDFLNRMAPALPAGAMKTYAIRAPRSTHFRPATCTDVRCEAYEHGWSTTVNEADDLGARQAHYIRKQSGRKFVERSDAPGFVTFAFEAGQRCFRSDDHRVRLDRPEIYTVRDGDYRGNPRRTETYIHTRPELWVEDFGTHQQTLADRLEAG